MVRNLERPLKAWASDILTYTLQFESVSHHIRNLDDVKSLLGQHLEAVDSIAIRIAVAEYCESDLTVEIVG